MAVPDATDDKETYPRRKLGPAEHWGRTVETRIEDVAQAHVKSSESLEGGSRYEASSAGDMTRIASGLEDVADGLAAAINQFPQYFTASAQATNFSIPTSWRTVASLSIPRPSGFNRLELTAQGTTSVIVQGPVDTGGFKWPFPLSSVTREFGPRPPLPYHNGIDFGQAQGTTIPASADGTVILKDYYDDWGNYLRIGHAPSGSTTIWTGYAHMRVPATWSVGDTIRQGQKVGEVGTTGQSTGPHLHFETAVNGTRINPRDFMAVFGESGGGSTSDPTKTRARLVIGGTATIPFEPFSPGGADQLHFALGGTSRSVSGTTEVEVQLIADVSSPADPSNLALLTVTGGFTP